jgi:hypothetical protein
MPNPINPNNYNVEFFQSYTFGDITNSNYLSYLFKQNLPELPPELVNSPAGNFSNKYEEKGSLKTINYSTLSNPGSVDEWVMEGNYPVSLFDISYSNPSQNLGANQYGPSSIQSFNYENPNLIVEDTGFIQYPTSVGGDLGSTLLSTSLNAVGISSTNFIKFDSPLNDIAQERRKEEIKNRVKQNIIDETLGKINLDPLGLLTGQPIIWKDYKITKPADGLLGGAVNLLSDIAGVNTLALTSVLGGPIPKGAFDGNDINSVILNRTGNATKNLIFKSINYNKYGPVIDNSEAPLKKPLLSFNSNQTPQKEGYLTFNKEVEFKDNVAFVNKAFADYQKIPDLNTTGAGGSSTTAPTSKNKGKLSGVIDKIKNIGKKDDELIQPTESSSPTVTKSPSVELSNKGFEFDETTSTFENVKVGWDGGHTQNWSNGTQYIPVVKTKGLINDQQFVYDGRGAYRDGDLFWKDGRETGLPKRGLLKYTQELINKTTNQSGDASQFIGLPNSDINYDGYERGETRHKEMSMGNLVKETKENKYYCRSWSVRNAYNTYSDLIRHDALWRESQPGSTTKSNTKLNSFSTLREPGIPKIAWERDGEIEQSIIKQKSDELKGATNIDKKFIIPYMFSIENLAWKGSPHYDKLPLCEQGPHGGRIMWFPPYNINFTDNVSVNWDTTNFIGRGEPIYTYNNTERTGTLSFTIIVDHPSIVNVLKERVLSTEKIGDNGEPIKISASQNLETFFAGCSTEEIKQIVRESFKEYLPPEEPVIPTPEETKPKEFVKQNPPEIKEILSFHFKNATRKETEQQASKGDFVNYADPNIILNTSCPDGILGRCFDYNYETTTVDWYDNPRLYKGGSNNNGSNGECPSGDLVINDFNIDDLVPIPGNGTASRPIKPPCNGKNFRPYGPKSSVVTELSNGNQKNIKLLWSDKGKGYKTENYCCPIDLTGHTIGSTTYTNFSDLGFYEFRDGANQRFFGTGSYPFDNGTEQFGKSPELELPITPAGGWTFQADNGGVAGAGISQLIEFLTTTSLGKEYTINVVGHASNTAEQSYNKKLGEDRSESVYNWMREQMVKLEEEKGVPKLDVEESEPIELFTEKSVTKEANGDCVRWNVKSKGKEDAEKLGLPGDDNRNTPVAEFTLTPSAIHPSDYQNEGQLAYRRVDIVLTPNLGCVKEAYDKKKEIEENRQNALDEEQAKQLKDKINNDKAKEDKERKEAIESAKNFVNECDYFETIKKDSPFIYDSIAEKLKNFHPAFHSITPEGFNTRITFLQQCGRQGPSFIDPEQPQNTAFGRPPVCILRLGDFYFTKIIIDSINFTFDPLQWDLNPEGIGVQPMLVNVDLNFKFIGGSTLQGPLSQLQNAVSYNFFGNTSLYMSLEKILTSRGKAGDLISDGIGRDKRTYYYGPWASQSDFEDTIKEDQKANAVDTTQNETTNKEAAKDDVVEKVSSPPCEGGVKLTKEQVESNVNVSETVLTNYPLESYDYYTCPDSEAVYPVLKEESNPLNAVDGEDKTKSEVFNEQETQNTLSEHCNTPGFNNKTGAYTTQESITLESTIAEGPQGKQRSFAETIVIPKGTVFYLDGGKVRANKIISKQTGYSDTTIQLPKTQTNTLTLSCNDNVEIPVPIIGNITAKGQFLLDANIISSKQSLNIKNLKGYYVEKQGSTIAANSVFYDTIKKVFCKDNNTLKSWNELTNCKE